MKFAKIKLNNKYINTIMMIERETSKSIKGPIIATDNNFLKDKIIKAAKSKEDEKLNFASISFDIADLIYYIKDIKEVKKELLKMAVKRNNIEVSYKIIEEFLL